MRRFAAVFAHHQRRCGSESLEILPPKLFRLRQVLILEPCNVVAIGARWRQFQVPAAGERFINGENLVEQRCDGPAIQ